MPARHHLGRRRLRLPPARSLALVGVGGALGTLARFAVSLVIDTSEGAWPLDTFVVNVSGAFVLAVLVALVTAGLDGAWVRPLLGTGLLGGYTTFSTLSLQVERLAAGGVTGTALAYPLMTLVAGVMAAWAGTAVAMALHTLRRRRHTR